MLDEGLKRTKMHLEAHARRPAPARLRHSHPFLKAEAPPGLGVTQFESTPMPDSLNTVAHYREKLTAMHDRLAKKIADEREAAADAVDGPGQDGILHTHNADMDAEGVDAAVGRARGLRDELRQADLALGDLRGRGDDETLDETHAARLDSLLETQAFAEKMDAKYAGK